MSSIDPTAECERAARVVLRRLSRVVLFAALTATLTGAGGLLIGALTLLGTLDKGDPVGTEVAALYLVLSAPTATIFGHLWRRTPAPGDNLDEWHRALDHAVGVLLVLPGMLVAGWFLDELATAVLGPLIALGTVGALYATLTTFRSSFHTATRHKYRGALLPLRQGKAS